MRTTNLCLARPRLARTLLALAALFTVACSPTSDPYERVPLRKYERKVFSQFGEDGVIEKIFQIIEPTTKFAVEFGASNGIRYSNVRNLILEHG